MSLSVTIENKLRYLLTKDVGIERIAESADSSFDGGLPTDADSVWSYSIELLTLPGVTVDLNDLENGMKDAFAFDLIYSFWIENTSDNRAIIKPLAGGTGWLGLLSTSSAILYVPGNSVMHITSVDGFVVDVGAGDLQFISNTASLATVEIILIGRARES